jgi:hypothetical protein
VVEVHSNIQERLPVNAKVVTNFCESYPSRFNDTISGDRSNPELLVYPQEETIPPKSSVNVQVKFSPAHCGQHRWAITCEVAGGKVPREYAVVNTFAAAPDANLMPSSFDFGIVYLGIPVQRTTCIKNLSKLPGHFQWSKEVINDSSSLALDCQPQEGVLSPHEIKEISVSLTPKNLGENKYIARCNILGMLHPLELHIRLYVMDISCSYYVDTPLHFCNTHPHTASIDRTRLPTLDFGKRCSLGRIYCLWVAVQNESGLPGMIRVSVTKHDARPFLSHKQFMELTNMCLNRDMKTAGGLGDTHENSMHYFSTYDGCAMAQKKLWSSTCAKAGQGLAVLLSSYEGHIEAWKSWYCQVVCFACMPGTYCDILHFKVR